MTGLGWSEIDLVIRPVSDHITGMHITVCAQPRKVQFMWKAIHNTH